VTRPKVENHVKRGPLPSMRCWTQG